MKLYEYIYYENRNTIAVNEYNCKETDKMYISDEIMSSSYSKRLSKTDIGSPKHSYSETSIVLLEDDIDNAKEILSKYYEEKIEKANIEIEKYNQKISGLKEAVSVIKHEVKE